MSANDTSDLSAYNVIGGLSRLGPSILLRAVHEMRDPSDVQNLLLSCRDIANVSGELGFIWAVSRVLTETYNLTSVPIHLVDLVCTFLFHYQP